MPSEPKERKTSTEHASDDETLQKVGKVLNVVGGVAKALNGGKPLVTITADDEEEEVDPHKIIRRAYYRPAEADIDTRPRAFVDRFLSTAERERVVARGRDATAALSDGPQSTLWARLGPAVWRRIAVTWLLPDDLLAMRLVSRDVASSVGDNAVVWAMLCLRDMPRRTGNLPHLREFTKGVTRLIETVANACSVKSDEKHTAVEFVEAVTVHDLATVIPTPEAARWAKDNIGDDAFREPTVARLRQCIQDNGQGLCVPEEGLREKEKERFGHYDASFCARERDDATGVAFDVGRQVSDAEAAALAEFGPREFYLKWRGPLLRQFVWCNREKTDSSAWGKAWILARGHTADQMLALLCYRNGMDNIGCVPNQFRWASIVGRGHGVRGTNDSNLRNEMESARWMALCPICRYDADILHRYIFANFAEATEAWNNLSQVACASGLIAFTWPFVIPFATVFCGIAGGIAVLIAGPESSASFADFSISPPPTRQPYDGVMGLLGEIFFTPSTSALSPWLPTVAITAATCAAVGFYATRQIEHPTTRLARRSANFAALRWACRCFSYFACSATEAYLALSLVALQQPKVPIASTTLLPSLIAGAIAVKMAQTKDMPACAVATAVTAVFGAITVHPGAFAALVRREVLPGLSAGLLVVNVAFIGLRALMRFNHRTANGEPAASMSAGEKSGNDIVHQIPEPYTCDEEPSPETIPEFKARFKTKEAVAKKMADQAAYVGIVDELIAGTLERCMVFTGVAWPVAWACRAVVTATATAAELFAARTSPREVW